MFIRTVKVPSSNGTVHEYVRIVEAYRDNGWSKQRTVADLGRKDVLTALLPQLQRVLTMTTQGRGLVRVDKENAPHVWHALRGGYHYHVARTGLISTTPKKNLHSHPGDAMTYGAAVLFPLNRLPGTKNASFGSPPEAVFFSNNRTQRALIGGGTLGMTLPKDGSGL